MQTAVCGMTRAELNKGGGLLLAQLQALDTMGPVCPVRLQDSSPPHQLVVDKLQVGLGVAYKVLQGGMDRHKHSSTCVVSHVLCK